MSLSGWLPVEVSGIAQCAAIDFSPALRSKPGILEAVPLTKERREADSKRRNQPHERQPKSLSVARSSTVFARTRGRKHSQARSGLRLRVVCQVCCAMVFCIVLGVTVPPPFYIIVGRWSYKLQGTASSLSFACVQNFIRSRRRATFALFFVCCRDFNREDAEQPFLGLE